MLRKINACGIDEVGRGALAGPLVVACVSFKKYSNVPFYITDSKRTSLEKRKQLFFLIKKTSFVSYSFIFSSIIDQVGISKATEMACCNAVKKNRKNLDLILLDGNIKLNLNIKLRNIIKGDSNYVSIAAASIIAKYVRDRYMKFISMRYSKYLWSKNVGYGTKEHLKALKKYGITKFHRKTFKPVKDLLNNNDSKRYL